MDKLNWTILEALQQNARHSYSEIGRIVSLSAPAVAERIQRMEKSGIIKGYQTVIDLDKIGLPLQAIVGLKISQTGNFKNFVKILETIPEVYECTRVTGRDCLFIKLAVRDSLQLENIIDKFVEYGETTTSIVLSNPIESKVFRSNGQKI